MYMYFQFSVPWLTHLNTNVVRNIENELMSKIFEMLKMFAMKEVRNPFLKND